jgi:flagellar motor protein MotB
MDGVRLVSIVLFADEQIDLLLSTPQLQVMSPQAIQAIDLPMLTRQEAAAYMLFLLKSEGLSEKLALDEIKLNRLYRETKGNPGQLASAILNAVGEHHNGMTPDSYLSGYRKQLLIGGLPLLLAVLLLMWLISSLFETEPDTVVDDRQVEKTIDPLPAPASHSEPKIPAADRIQAEATPPQPLESQVEEPSETQPPVFEAPLASVQDSLETAKPDAVADTLAEEEVPPPPGLSLEDSQVIASSGVTDQAEQAAEISTEVEQAAETIRGDVSVNEVDQAPQQSVVMEAELADEALSSAAAGDQLGEISEETDAQQEISQTVEVVQETKAPVTLKEPVEDATTAWVRSRPPSDYTLQLIAVENLDSLKRYIKNNGLAGEAQTFKMTRNGKPWYALLWGDFPDRNSALQAATTLPAKVQKTGVWARTFSSLQQSIAQ